ncbi:Hypothetical protein A7982_10123 [Minicystis rosea]|nr:Hypothetical protein A7982_10123 [Minicystis rosea]
MHGALLACRVGDRCARRHGRDEGKAYRLPEPGSLHGGPLLGHPCKTRVTSPGGSG